MAVRITLKSYYPGNTQNIDTATYANAAAAVAAVASGFLQVVPYASGTDTAPSTPTTTYINSAEIASISTLV